MAGCPLKDVVSVDSDLGFLLVPVRSDYFRYCLFLTLVAKMLLLAMLSSCIVNFKRVYLRSLTRYSSDFFEELVLQTLATDH